MPSMDTRAAAAATPASPPAPDPAAGGTAAVALPRGAILALSMGGFCSAISLRVSDALLPRLADTFAVSIGSAASVVTVFALAYGIAQLFFGPVGDRYGKYRVIAWGATACVASAMLCALAPGFEALLGARLVAGATAASIIPLAMAWIGDVVPYAERQPVLARFLIGQILGISGGVVLGGYAADHLDWRTPFAVIAALFACNALVLLRIHRRLPAAARRTGAGGFSPRRMAGEFGQVLARPWARRVLLTVFIEGLGLFGAFAFVATHLHQRFGLGLAAAGGIVMVYGLGGLLFALVAGRLVRRLGESGLTAWGAVLIAASLAAVAFAPSWPVAVPACFVCGLGFYMLHNTLQINATQMAPERRGAAVSSFASCFFLGQAAGVALAGFAVSRIGTGPTIALGGVVVLAVGLNFARMRRRPAAQGAGQPAR